MLYWPDKNEILKLKKKSGDKNDNIIRITSFVIN